MLHIYICTQIINLDFFFFSTEVLIPSILYASNNQEKDLLERAIGKMMEICSPNVVLVEKTVSRNIQELLLKEGVTLILDMKLNRLERIARCTGSPIISFSEVLDKPKLKQCDYFHIEKFIEEHNNASEGGKRPSKTLMFLEGFPRPLGCTVCIVHAHCMLDIVYFMRTNTISLNK